MAAAEPRGGSQHADLKTRAAAGGVPGVVPGRGPGSVLKVSQLLLRTIAEHQRPTLATLRRELGSAGYEVRRRVARRAGEAAGPEAKGALLRVSGSDAAGYFRVCKVPTPKRKPPRRPQPRGLSPPRPGRPRRRRSKRRAAKKAREAWRRKARALEKVKGARARARVMGQERGQVSSEDTRPQAPKERRQSSKLSDKRRLSSKLRDKRRPSSKHNDRRRPSSQLSDKRRPISKLREEKRQEAERSVKRSIQSSKMVNTDSTSSGQKKVRTKTSTKADAPRDAVGSPSSSGAPASDHTEVSP